MIERTVGAACLFQPVCGPFPGVLDAQGRGDDGNLFQAVFVGGFQEHPRYTGVYGHPRHQAPLLGQLEPLPSFIMFDGPQFLQYLEAVADALAVRWVDEGEVGGVTDVKGEHPQDDLRQVGAQDFRGCVEGSRFIVFFGEQADADTVLHTAAPALTLVRAAPGDRRDGEVESAGARVVTGDACKARVDDVADAGNGDRRLGDVRRHDDLPPPGGLEDAPLLFPGKP